MDCSQDVLREGGEDFLYLSAIAFIKELKKGVPFAESSPMLNDISGLPTWSKVGQGKGACCCCCCQGGVTGG